MKKILFVLFLLVGLNCAAQDEVVFHNGEHRGTVPLCSFFHFFFVV